MSDSIFDSITSQQSPDGSDTATAQPDMLAYANQQLASGLSQEDAIKATYDKYPTQSGVRFGVSPSGQFTDLAAAKGNSIFDHFGDDGRYNGPNAPKTKEEIIRDNPSAANVPAESKLENFGKSALVGLQEGIINPALRAQAQVTNFLTHAGQGDFEPQEGGKVTPEQRAAAKLLGTDIGNDWGKILKMSPQQLAKYRQDADRLAGLDPAEQAKRDEDIAAGKEYSGPLEGLLQHSAAKDLIASAYNPNESNTILYHKVNEVAHLMDIEKNPTKYSDSEVSMAKELLDQYRADAKKSTWDNVKEGLKQIKEHPLSLVNSTLADPELLLAPEAKFGTEVYGAKAAAAGKAAEQAARYQKLAESISMAGKGSTDIEEAAKAAATHYGDQAEKLLKQAQSLRSKQFLGDITSAAGSGAAINAAITAEQQLSEQGYVKKGTVPASAVTGAALGGGLAALGEAGALRSSHGDMSSRVDEATTREAGPDGDGASPQNAGTGKPPGEPLSPETPINKDSHVPYYGGVDKDGRVIHLDSSTPEKLTYTNRDGVKREVPVLKTVAYHEQVEYPLMHMEGPISAETLADLQGRMSPEDWKKIPPEVIKKLKEGKSLTYPEAHTYFATAAENHLVSTLYNVDPKVYQDGLKPHIKDVAEANKSAKAADIPENLDSKPYDDMGGTSSLKGQGDRPTIDNVEPGAAKHSDNKQKGKIDNRLLTTGVTTGLGAIAGGTLADQDNKYAGTIFGALSGFGLGTTMGRGDIGATGLGKREAGMFGGRRAATYNPSEERVATKMEEVGKTPEQIHFATGMSRDAQGNWVKEFSDTNSKLLPKDHPNWQRATEKPIPLSTVFDHPELDKAYPGLLDKVKILVHPDMKALGTFSPETNTIILGDLNALYKIAEKRPIADPRSVISHELQHAIQAEEGWGRGSSIKAEANTMAAVRDYLENRQESTYLRWQDAVNRGDTASIDKYDRQLKEIADQLDYKMAGKAQDAYQRNAAEVQARNVQARLNLSDEARATKSPRETEDVPLKNQVVRNRQSGRSNMELPEVKDNYTKPLSTYAHTLYHDTNIRNALELLPHSNVSSDVSEVYLTNHPDLATGQGGKSGILIKFNSEGLNGQINTAKPTWEYSWKQGQGEFITRHMRGDDFKNAVQSVTVKKGVRSAAAAVEKMQMNGLMQRLENQGWHKTTHENGDITLTKPNIPKNQQGNIEPELLRKLSKTALLGTLGATLGANLDPEHKIKGAWAGAALALVGGEINWSKLYPSIKSIQAKDPRFNVNDVLDNWDHARAASQRTTYQVQSRIKKLVPDKGSQVKITHWLDGDKTIPLTNKEYEAAKMARQFYDSLGQAALNTGVLKDFLNDYVNHEWGDNAKAKALQDQIEASITTNMSPKDRHALARKYLTIAQGKAAGLTPRTENIIELMGIYSDSMSRAMANKTLLDSLKVKKLDPKGDVSAVMPSGKAPYNYVAMQHPQLNNVRVHPSIAPSLDFLFHTYKKNAVVNAFESFNTAAKRMQVSFSMFHVKSLIDAYLGANTLTGTFKNLYDIATSATGKSEFHKQFASGGPGDIVDMAQRGGLKFDMGKVSSEDVNADALYSALDHTSKFLDNIIPGSGKLPDAVKAINKASDKFIWENVHTGLKGMTFMNVYERLQRSWAKERLNNPNAKVPSNDDLARTAASFTNDIFGGLNWRRLADDAQTKWGRSLALAMASPAGRRLSQVLLFAPDWTYSTIRSFVKAAGQGSGIKGLLKPKELADLHRQYIIRSSFIYLTLYNALNVALSGHPIWDNKDPLMVDLGNGEKMQANKHFLETPHMLMNPAKFALGKLGTAPSEVLDQLFHRDYLTPEGGPPMQGGRVEHAASRLLPFALEGGQNQGTPEKLMSALGFPIYGMTEENKRKLRAQRRREAEKKRDRRGY